MRPCLVWMVVLAGCGGGIARLVPQGGTTRLASNEGVLVVASEEASRVDLRLCVDGDRSRCAELGPTLADRGIEVYALPAGRYCLMHVRCEAASGEGAEHDVPEDEVRCVDVAAGQLVYPGHIVFDRSGRSGQVCAGRADFRLHETIDDEIRAAYPQLGSRATVSMPTARE